METAGVLSERTIPSTTGFPASDTHGMDTVATDAFEAAKREDGLSGDTVEKKCTSDQNNNTQSGADDRSAAADDRSRGADDTRIIDKRSLRSRPRRRLVPEKIRHKRQTLQDMARPLKQWLYKHRDNPYPSKSEKVKLAAGSHMTLIQVSNWFANARRRLKNTVRDPALTWSNRIKLYNTNVVGNAELFSVTSDDSLWDSDDEDAALTFPTEKSEAISDNQSVAVDVLDLVPSRTATPMNTSFDLRQENVSRFSGSDDMGAHIKYKHTILQRYLNDHYHHPVTCSLDDRDLPRTRDRRQSGSMGSRDYEEMSTSSASSPFNDVHHVFDDFPEEGELHVKKRRTNDDREDELYWKTWNAALALTDLAKSNQ